MLRASDLQATKDAKTQKNKEIYAVLLEKCYRTIKTRNDHGFVGITYKVPIVTPGLPLYNISHDVLYIVNRLKKGGFSVINVQDNLIEIYWGKKRV